MPLNYNVKHQRKFDGPTNAITARLPREEYVVLRDMLSRRDDLTVADLVRQLLREWIKEQCG